MCWPESNCRDPLPVHLVSLTPKGCHEMDSSREEKMGGPELTWKRSVEKEMREAGWTWNQVQVWASVRQHFKSLVTVVCATQHLEDEVSKLVFQEVVPAVVPVVINI